MSRQSQRAFLAIALVLAALAPASCKKPPQKRTDVERRIADSLCKDEKGNPLQEVYAENITFPELEIRPAGSDKLRLDFVVRNAGKKKVVVLDVMISLLDKEGVQVAGDTDCFAHGWPFGENNTPILPNSAKRAGGELENPRGWKEGKVVVTITGLRVE